LPHEKGAAEQAWRGQTKVNIKPITKPAINKRSIRRREMGEAGARRAAARDEAESFVW